MRQDTKHQDINTEHISNPDVAHEHSDVNVRALIWGLVALVISGIVVHVGLWGMMRLLEMRAESNDPTPHPLVEVRQGPTDPNQVFPEPRLQPNAAADLQKFKASQEQHINGYGWVDKNAGVAHIPIDEAIKRVAGQNLPYRPSPQLAPPPASDMGRSEPSLQSDREKRPSDLPEQH